MMNLLVKGVFIMKLRERLELMALLLAIFNDYFDLVEKLLNLFG